MSVSICFVFEVCDLQVGGPSWVLQRKCRRQIPVVMSKESVKDRTGLITRETRRLVLEKMFQCADYA